MNLVEEIKARLKKYPEVRFESDTSSITVFPSSPDGFGVTLLVNAVDSYTLSFEGWHEDFEVEEEARNVFALALSNECRLKEYRRGNFAYKWTLEFLEDGNWEEQSTTGLLLFPFWMKKSVRYLQNNLLRRN
jgi:hypothetical protein